MKRWIHGVGGVAVAACLAALAPGSAIAAGGGSAGDQQYVDPLAGLHSHTHKSTPSTKPSSTGPTPSATTAPTTSAVTPGSQAATTTSAGSAPATSTASTASGGRKLPFTGFDPLPSVGAGIALIAGGFALRRKARSA
jgi:hypothetical protein